MGFGRDMVVQSLEVAQYNKELAAQFLLGGIPDNLVSEQFEGAEDYSHTGQ